MPKTVSKPSTSLVQLPQANIVSLPSSSPLENVYRSPSFQLARDNNVPFHVAENLIRLRHFRKQSQAQIAKEVGTSQSAIARIESGEENITLSTLQRLIKALKGRFFLSIQPEEFPVQRKSQWWELSGDTTYMLLGTKTFKGQASGCDVAMFVTGFVKPCETLNTTWPKALISE